MFKTSSVPMVGDFVRESLDLHLFMARIMREHAIFMQAGFLPKDVTYAQQAEQFKCQYDEILKEAIMLSDCTASVDVLSSGELVTDKTFGAEAKTQELTGICIDSALTSEELRLKPDPGTLPQDIAACVQSLNQKSMILTTSFAQFKALVWDQVTKCCLFTNLFPSQYAHIHREALFYLKLMSRLQNNRFVDARVELYEQKLFWDEIMAEHAQIIAHLLDPAEKKLCHRARDFARQFTKLEQKLKGEGIPASGLEGLRRENIQATKAIAEFKAANTELLLDCQIKSLLSPLLTDHTLREAYYYLRILKTLKLVYLGRG
ncbi:DUF2935 domain-containing protein [Desulfosporosinus sp. PR]|uniref:DUF2935 domain-containing protein n=1 Tax=Candidatus Desulfosporosinus nitrosoreducens TaxID=3401928 RepID=UPI0027EECCD7|nr:DUF2935 domain-containing protein [Desulfosporosinus sp. PR]MDQ7092754.1 DUF2935 domain-containing protein [Desulfosporosinus sp. PR]